MVQMLGNFSQSIGGGNKHVAEERGKCRARLCTLRRIERYDLGG